MLLTKRHLLITFIILVLSKSVVGQAIGDYRTAADGNWTTLATWQRLNALPASTPANWVTPTGGQGYPGQNAVPATVTIRDTHDVILNATTTVGNLVIGGGASGTLTTSAANPNLTINTNLTINLGASFTFSSTGSLNVTGTSQVTGTFVDNENVVGGTDTFTGLVTITGTWTTTAVTQENRIIFDGGVTNAGTFNAGGIQIGSNGTVTANALMTIGSGLDSDDNLTISGSNTVAVTGDESNIALLGSTGAAAGNLTINGTLVLTGTTGAGVLDVTGNTTVNGVLTLNSASQGNADFHGTFTNNGNFTDNSDSGINIFYGLVTNTGNWTTTSVTTVANMIFQNGITNNGNFSAGAATFNIRNQPISGSSNTTFANTVTVTGFTVTNTGKVFISNAAAGSLTGTGNWTQGVNGELNYSGTSIGVAFNASATGNIVNYNGAGNQLISSVQHYHLTTSTSGTKSLTATTDINGNLTIQNTSSLSANGQNMTLAGNWNVLNTASFSEGTAIVTLDGSSSQTIANPSGEVFYNLIISNSSGASPQITLNNSVTITNVLTMTSGNTNLNGNAIVLSSSALGALVHGLTSASGWMYGGSFRRTFAASTAIAIGNVRGFFPLGSSSDWRPFFVGVNGIAGTNGTITVSHTNALTTSIVSIADPGPPTILRRHDSNWTVSTATISAGTWILRAGGDNFGTIAAGAGDIRMATSAGVVGTHAAGSGGPTDWRVNRTGLAFGSLTNNFHVASTDGSTSPLPIKLTYFNAKLDNNQVRLTWETAQEVNNDFFTVEKTSDLESFESVVELNGQGTSQEVNRYSALDPNPYFGRSYYRLKQTDFDGKFTYSKVQVIDYEGAEFVAYPSPSKGSMINVEMTLDEEIKSVPIQIVNMQGQKVFERTFEVKVPGMLREEIVFENTLAPGLYLIKSGLVLFRGQKIVVE